MNDDNDTFCKVIWKHLGFNSTRVISFAKYQMFIWWVLALNKSWGGMAIQRLNAPDQISYDDLWSYSGVASLEKYP